MTASEATKILECMATDMIGALSGLGSASPMADVIQQRLEAVNVAQFALRAQAKTEHLWHDAKTCPPKGPGLYYGKKDDTNSMWACQYRDGIWTLDLYPEQKMDIVQWADYS